MNHCVPIVFFEKVSVNGRPKGNAVFHGFGILESAELVTQYDQDKCYFANYRFSFSVLSLSEENEQFDWQWITDRCDPNKTTEETMKHAPKAWKRFIKDGIDSLHLIRRSVAGKNLVKKKDQLPGNESLLNSSRASRPRRPFSSLLPRRPFSPLPPRPGRLSRSSCSYSLPCRRVPNRLTSRSADPC